ncbi:MAG: hypothetical protein KA285_06510 [Bacteroidia bacterium]|nr:hypothetical protein [Bacteroidia bacterium]
MTKKILLLFALVASMVSSASAYVIIIQGGGPNHTYNYVRLTGSRCECRGNGNNNCPVRFTATAGERKINMEDVVNEVLARQAKGESEGSFVYEEVMPVEWKTTVKNEIVITTKEDEVDLPK